MPTSPELIAAGELLIDLISTDYTEDFRSATTYRRYPGGSPANLAMNLARLGRRPGLIASVGQDDVGTLLAEQVSEAGVDISHLRRSGLPTTLILVTKSRATSDFEPYRSADSDMQSAQFPTDYLAAARVFHTTAFALSRQPARRNILDAATRAVAGGARPSIDANYAAKIWPNRVEAMGIIAYYLGLGGNAGRGCLAKFSDVDYERLFGSPVGDPAAAAGRIIELGAGVVCLTLGGEGVYIKTPEEEFHLPARPVEVKDTTGAGDAFWSGFLAAYLEEYDWHDCARAGRALAELKLSRVGAVRDQLRVEELLI